MDGFIWSGLVAGIGAAVAFSAPLAPPPTAAPPPAPVTAPAPAQPSSGGVLVSSAAELSAALTSATPGETIRLADGTYGGQFVVTVPVTLTGSRAAVLDGGSTSKGYALHIDGASGTVVSGLSVTGGQKGIVIDGADDVTITDADVGLAGQELVHWRNGSDRGVLSKSTLHDSGLTDPRFGEGAYVGTAESNWNASTSRTGGQPDVVIGAQIVDNTFSGITAEIVDVKEGTQDTLIRGNTADGSAISGKNYADSYVDLKGMGGRVENNTFLNPSPAVVTAVQQHSIVAALFGGNAASGNLCSAGLDCVLAAA